MNTRHGKGGKSKDLSTSPSLTLFVGSVWLPNSLLDFRRRGKLSCFSGKTVGGWLRKFCTFFFACGGEIVCRRLPPFCLQPPPSPPPSSLSRNLGIEFSLHTSLFFEVRMSVPFIKGLVAVVRNSIFELHGWHTFFLAFSPSFPTCNDFFWRGKAKKEPRPFLTGSLRVFGIKGGKNTFSMPIVERRETEQKMYTRQILRLILNYANSKRSVHFVKNLV